jgi:hypothetical protein
LHEENFSMSCLYGKSAMTFIMRFKQQKHLQKRKWEIINCEDDVKCGNIAFCDKRSLLTGNGLLLQRALQKEMDEF